MIAVDTNVLLYSLDASEPAKRGMAQELLRDLRTSSDRTILPWQVLCETTSQLRSWSHKKRISVETANSYIQSFRGIFPIKIPRAVVFDYALELFERFSLSHWDSLLIAACADAGVTRLYSEDMGHGMDFDGVFVINPFMPISSSP
ncbi:MAG: PIN domain-containing protein [Planctomycetia bacterium]|nr:PIN domain-containing protein [Planctomycetia bacterium]